MSHYHKMISPLMIVQAIRSFLVNPSPIDFNQLPQEKQIEIVKAHILTNVEGLQEQCNGNPGSQDDLDKLVKSVMGAT